MSEAALKQTTDNTVPVNGNYVPPKDWRARFHQEQYDETAADFFDYFNKATGRTHLYLGFIRGRMGEILPRGNNGTTTAPIATDFGCGTGWLPPQLLNFGFSKVLGIDTSPFMLGRADNNVQKEFLGAKNIIFKRRFPESMNNKCRLVTAIHVHHHFLPLRALREKFFGAIASMLEPSGHAIIIGCPSDYIAHTPPHYQNSIKDELLSPKQKNEVQDFVRDGYVDLSTVQKYAPDFKMPDGAEMKVTFRFGERPDSVRSFEVKDTFWSDETLVLTAHKEGLELIARDDLPYGIDYPHAYMALHFRKPAAIRHHAVPLTAQYS